MRHYTLPALMLVLLHGSPATADQVITENLITQGSACTGFDCVNNEAFADDTLRLKENNLRIHFADTQVTNANDWRITTNDQASGGANYCGIEDATAGLMLFRLSAGAPADSLFVASSGKLGLLTNTPQLDLHLRTTNTPALRWEQNTSEGQTAQTWELAGNEANFFVRDVTGGSRLPWRIRPGAPLNSLIVASNGAIGVGTSLPVSPLHVYHSSGGATVRISEATGSSNARTLLTLRNFGAVASKYAIGTSGWVQSAATSQYALAPQSTQLAALTLDTAGNVVIRGVLSQGSSRSLKTDIEPLDAAAALDAAKAVPVMSWRYAAAPDQTDRHLGPIAEVFHARTAVGGSPRSLAPGDLAALLAASAQALNHQIEAKDAELQALLDRLDKLEDALARAGDQP